MNRYISDQVGVAPKRSRSPLAPSLPWTQLALAGTAFPNVGALHVCHSAAQGHLQLHVACWKRRAGHNQPTMSWCRAPLAHDEQEGLDAWEVEKQYLSLPTLGKICEENGYSCVWKQGQAPPSAQRRQNCTVLIGQRSFVPGVNLDRHI